MPTTTDALLNDECNGILAFQGFQSLTASSPSRAVSHVLTTRSAECL